MLIKDVVLHYGDRVRFVSENWGSSKLAARFGVKRYPVVFVDDALVARPEDFGGWGVPTGKYAPWHDSASQDRFERDLAGAIDGALAGDAVAPSSASASATEELRALPNVAFVDRGGRRVGAAELAGKVVLVDFWATWCGPCRVSLPWLARLERKYGGKVVVVAVALDSPAADIEKLRATSRLPAHVVDGTDDIARPFGGVSSLPTMFVFDAQGRAAATFYGAPSDLHSRAERLVASLLGPKASRRR